MPQDDLEKVDLKKELKQFYGASAKAVAEIDLPALDFLMVDGRGDPGTSQSYAEAVEALFSVSYTAKFMVKKSAQAIDYGVMPLEALWWAHEMSAFTSGRRDEWQWTAMILQPSFVGRAVIEQAMAEVERKKGLPGIARLRLESFTEGRCAQILHVGPFSDEGPTIEKLHAHIDAHSALRGKHHEIYLSDIRRAAPGKWRTILRQPMQ